MDGQIIATAETTPTTSTEATGIYRLEREGHDVRVERLTEVKAKVRNAAREKKGQDGRWVLDPTAEDGELTDSPAIRARESADLKAKAEQTEAKAAKVTTPTDTGNRVEWNGLSMCDVIRYCGSQKWNAKQTRAVAEHCGMNPAKGTIHIQLGNGRHGVNVPEVKEKWAATFAKVATKAAK